MKKTKELPNIMSLGTKPPKSRPDEIPHWKVWRFAIKNPGIPWKR
jgi:hypothetical protein